MTKRKEKPTGIPIDTQSGEALRYLVGTDRPAWAKRIIGELLENRIMETRQVGQMPAQSLAPAVELLASVRKEVDALHEELQIGRLSSWRAYVKGHPPSAEAIALLVIVGHEMLLKVQATTGARKRHAPTRDAMALVHDWWFKNGEGKMTKDDAADAIVDANLVSEKRSAIRKWLYPEPLNAGRIRLASASKR